MATQLISVLLLMAGDIEENPGPGDEPYRFTTKNILRQLEEVVEWKSLGIELDISSAKLNEIERNDRGMVGDCKRDMVGFWMASDTSASWDKLAQALDNISQNVRAEEVRALGRQEAANPMAPIPQAIRDYCLNCEVSRGIGEDPPPAVECGVHVQLEHKPLPPPYSLLDYWLGRTLRYRRKRLLYMILAVILLVLVWFATNMQTKYIIIETELSTSQIQPTTFHMHASTTTTPTSPPVTTSRALASAASTQTPTTLTSQPTQAPATSQVNDQMQVPTQPPSAPVWSFSSTCTGITLSDTTLSASCTMLDGRTAKRSQLDLNCIIENANGVLKWAKEDGNFKYSSKSWELSSDHDAENILRGKCRILDLSRYIDCSINLSEGIENIDGNLTPRNGSGCKPVRKCTISLLGKCIY